MRPAEQSKCYYWRNELTLGRIIGRLWCVPGGVYMKGTSLFFVMKGSPTWNSTPQYESARRRGDGSAVSIHQQRRFVLRASLFSDCGGCRFALSILERRT